MKKLLILIVFIVGVVACRKDRYVFTMKLVTLNSYHQSQYPAQNIYIKIIDIDEGNATLATTGAYTSSLPLPLTLTLNPNPKIHLYKEHITVQLWGDSTGLIGSSAINMKNYKISFQLTMETKSSNLDATISGTWQ